MSRNMPMQVSQMWTHPRVYTSYERLRPQLRRRERGVHAGVLDEGRAVQHRAQGARASSRSRSGAGLPIYLAPDLGFTRLESDLKDYEDFLSGKRPGAVLSQVNPLLTAPVEFATRQDIFTGQKFEEGETVPVGGRSASPSKCLATAARPDRGRRGRRRLRQHDPGHQPAAGPVVPVGTAADGRRRGRT